MPPLTHFDLRPSVYLTVMVAVSALGGLVCLSLSSAPLWLMASGFVLCVLTTWRTAVRHTLLYNRCAIVRCILEANNEWCLYRRDGKQQRVRLQGTSWRSRHLIVLNFYLLLPSTGWRTYLSSHSTTVLICKDSLPPITFRRLQIHLTLLKADAFTNIPDGFQVTGKAPAQTSRGAYIAYVSSEASGQHSQNLKDDGYRQLPTPSLPQPSRKLR